MNFDKIETKASHEMAQTFNDHGKKFRPILVKVTGYCIQNNGIFRNHWVVPTPPVLQCYNQFIIIFVVVPNVV